MSDFQTATRRQALLGIVSLPAMAGAAAQSSRSIRLFDGYTLRGWHAVPRAPVPGYPGGPEPDRSTENYRATMANTGRWFVQDGAIIGGQQPPSSGLGSWLLTDDTYADFDLNFEANPDWPADTGILVRTTANGSQGFQIHYDYRVMGSIGTIYGNGIGPFRARHYAFDRVSDANGRPRMELREPLASEKQGLSYMGDPKRIIRALKVDSWNTVRVRVVGAMPVITTWLNDVKVVEFDAARYAANNYDAARVLGLLGPRGHIALEVHSNDGESQGIKRWGPDTVCRFRNLVLRPLSS